MHFLCAVFISDTLLDNQQTIYLMIIKEFFSIQLTRTRRLFHNQCIKYYNKEYQEGFLGWQCTPQGRGLSLNLKGEVTIHSCGKYIVTEGISTVFLYVVYRSRPPKMLKYVKNVKMDFFLLNIDSCYH